MFNKITQTIVGILFLISVAGNVYFILGKGIQIDKSSHISNHNEQFQGQMMINMMMERGDKIVWTQNTFRDASSAINYLTTLHPTSSYFTKIIQIDNKILMIVPDFITNAK